MTAEKSILTKGGNWTNHWTDNTWMLAERKHSPVEWEHETNLVLKPTSRIAEHW